MNPFIIDPPSPFATRQEWAAFLPEAEELLKKHPDNELLKAHIAEAKSRLADD
jgi:hypothetical protein